jgi:hypothetical protein
VRQIRIFIPALALVLLLPPGFLPQVPQRQTGKPREDRMSTMGRWARERIQEIVRSQAQRGIRIPEPCNDSPRCAVPQGIDGTQAETTIAVDSTGQHVVIGFNDFRGFNQQPFSISGYMYSDDGGRTFIDGGQLPTPGTDEFAGQLFPQVFGDPDVKYLGGCNFIYSSLLLKKNGSGLAGTLSIHRSTDCGHTWNGPIEVTPATNPNGLVDLGGNALDFADKELMSVDPDTGRVILAWANFTPVARGGVEISATYTDNILSASPNFSPRRVIASRPPDGQGAAIQFAGNGSPNVYLAWSTFPSFYGNSLGYARSTDNGATWSAPADVVPDFLGMDQVLGNDRVNSNPAIDVDRSPGPFRGSVYIVYSNNNSGDGADVAFQRSTNRGLTFSPPVFLNSRPGNDRAQWFPYVTVDETTGRVTVFYYDQGIDTSGHLTEVTYLYSDDGGVTWSKPAPLSEEPFKAGWGNTTSQPNLGDYNQAVAQRQILYAAYAGTRQERFTSGQPSTEMTVPDVFFAKVPPGPPKTSLRLGTITLTESGGNGNIDPGETVRFRIPLSNYVTNPLNAGLAALVSATLRSLTPGVTVSQAVSAYPNIAPGSTGTNLTEYVVNVPAGFNAGRPIELELNVTAGGSETALRFQQRTGTPLYATLLTENFDGVPAGTLPFGWEKSHGAGDNEVAWRTSGTFCGPSNKAFHQNASDGPAGGSPARWERLFSPVVKVPSNSDYVMLEFDVCYDTEDDPVLRVQAYDGLFLRVTDFTSGRTLRSILAEAFEQEFFTGPMKHYPKHLPRNSDPNYFDDMSAWAGDSGGPRRVRMKLPGMAGSTVQLRFEYTQDGIFTCAAVRPGRTCGVSIDNLVMRSVANTAPPSVVLTVVHSLSRNPVTNRVIANIMVTNSGTATATNAMLTNALLATAGPISDLPTLGSIAPGATATAILRFPGTVGPPGARSILRVNGTYSGGTFGGSFRVILP